MALNNFYGSPHSLEGNRHVSREDRNWDACLAAHLPYAPPNRDLSQKLDGLFALVSEQKSMIEKGTIHFIISFLVFFFSHSFYVFTHSFYVFR